MSWFKTYTVAVPGLIALALSASPSFAEVQGKWNPFSDKDSEWEQSFDRSFVREWEKNPPRGFPTVSKDNIAPMKLAIKKYAAIVSKGGWKSLPERDDLSTGMTNELISRLRRRLELTGDLRRGAGYNSVFDYYVEQAIKRFQERHGLAPTGIADKTTIMALNVPASVRLRQLRANLTRVKSMARTTGKRYVIVNVPAAQIEAVENGRVVSRHSAVVGKTDRQTPILRSKIYEINFNPYWTVPPTVLREDLVPKGREYAKRGKDILKIYRMSAFDAKGRKLSGRKINWNSNAVYGYTYRQDPWEDNSLGFVRINFHNKFAVFMHDTPSKSLFGRNIRAASSGCVRVQNVKKLVSWLLRDNGGWDINRVARMKQTAERLDVRIKKSIPVYFSYVTAWTTPNGTVNFRRDIYSRDGVGPTASAY